MQLSKRSKRAIGGVLTAGIISGIVAIIVIVVNRSMTCDSGTSKWQITRSIAPSTAGYSYKISSPRGSGDVTFSRNSLLSFTIGNISSSITFTKPSIASVFWPTWTFTYNGTNGIMKYSLVNPVNRYTISLPPKIDWETEQVLPKSIPDAIKVRDKISDQTIATFNSQPSLTKSTKMCMSDSITASTDQTILLAIAVSFEIK